MKPSSTNETHPGKYFARPPAATTSVFAGKSLVTRAISEASDPLLFLGDANTLAALWRVGAGARSGDRVVDLGEPLRLDDALLSAARERVGASDGRHLIAVGGGTLNDLAKVLSAEARRPFSLFATCASMNGWVSSNASIVRGGNKISVAARAPVHVLLDDDLLATAPEPLVGAGLADALCGPFACRDWHLAHLADGTSYDAEIIDAVLRSLAPLTRELERGASHAAVAPALTDALLVGGIAMSEAHSSAPASGAEHLVAHALDLLEIARGERPTLHGRAVAVGTILVAALWEVIAEHLASTPARGIVARAATEPDERAAAVAAWLPTLAPEAMAIVQAKQRREATRRSLDALCTDLRALPALPKVAQVRCWLQAAGAPTHVAAVHRDASFLHAALLLARDMRDRTTVFDLAYDLGVLPARADEVVARSGLAGV